MIIATILNIFLALLFIIQFDWGVPGSAVALVIAQGFSALLCIVYIVKKFPILRLQKQEEKKIPADIDYAAIPAMKTEARQRFTRVRPATVGQAARIPGITPADIALLLVHVKKAAEVHM